MAAPVTQLVSMPFLYNRYGDMRRLWVRASHAAQYDQWWIHIYVPSRRDGCNKRRHNFSQKLYHKDSWGLKCLLQFCDEAIAELCHKYPGNYLASHETSTFTKFFECWMLKDGYFWVIYYVIYSPVFIHNAAFIIYIWSFVYTYCIAKINNRDRNHHHLELCIRWWPCNHACWQIRAVSGRGCHAKSWQP